MRAKLRSISSLDVENIEEWVPAERDFSVGLRLFVGPDNGPGEETFDLVVCTGGWLGRNVQGDSVFDARHHLVVNHFNWPLIESYLRIRVAACAGANWNEVAMRVARLGHWEFEDYQP